MGLFGNSNSTNKKAVKRNKYLLNIESPFVIREAYKTLRTNIIFSLPGQSCKKIMFTSSDMGECKSTTTINLSIVFAENNTKCLLIDCDLRMSNIAQTLDLKETPGLSDILAGVVPYKDAIQHYRENMDVITAGTIPPNPSELLGSKSMQELISSVESDYDYIFFDTPPAGIVTDSVVLARMVDGFALIVKCGSSRKEEVSRCLKEVSSSGAKMLGFILTTADITKGKKKGYYYKK